MISQLMAGIAAAAIGSPDTRATNDACWQLIGSAIQRSAHATQPKFISYSERTEFAVNGKPANVFNSQITYRDDGMAYINDERWTYPMVSASVEPGPPSLGPYGDSRAAWLSAQSNENSSLPVIAHVYAHRTKTCRDAGPVTIDSRTVEHLIVDAENPSNAGLREIWIDPALFDIARLIVRAPMTMLVHNSPVQDLANFQVDVEAVDGHTVVRQVSWAYHQKHDGEYEDLAGNYEFMNYRFSDVEPPGTFSTVTASNGANRFTL